MDKGPGSKGEGEDDGSGADVGQPANKPFVHPFVNKHGVQCSGNCLLHVQTLSSKGTADVIIPAQDGGAGVAAAGP